MDCCALLATLVLAGPLVFLATYGLARLLRVSRKWSHAVALVSSVVLFAGFISSHRRDWDALARERLPLVRAQTQGHVTEEQVKAEFETYEGPKDAHGGVIRHTFFMHKPGFFAADILTIEFRPWYSGHDHGTHLAEDPTLGGSWRYDVVDWM